jgi:phosphatidylserine/phosphatidylglycerophosphate/cardiolipin synthase-like enzyme
MMYVLLATGFTGAWTLLFAWRWLRRKLGHLFAVAVFFSPKGGCTEAVVAEIKRARREILVLAYSFTSKPIAEALIEAKKRGVHVDMVLDRSQEKEAYSELPMIEEHGLYPHIDAHHAIAHNKVMIIDKRTLITGSFNFTHQAEAENGENLLIIKGHGELIGQYRQNFSLHKSHSQAPAQNPAQPAQKKAA